MNAVARSRPARTPTKAERSLADGFTAARATLPGQGGIAALREAAFRRFEEQGLPHRRLEAWRYTDLRAALKEAAPLVDGESAPVVADAGLLGDAFDARRLMFVDGRFVAAQSDLDALEPGLTIRPMAEALAANDPLVAHHLGLRVIEGRLGSEAMASADVQQAFDADPAVTLNTALMRDGALIHVARGTALQRPLHLVFVSGPSPASVFARSLILIDRGARLTLVESHPAGAGPGAQVNSVVEWVIGEEANVEHIKLIEGAPDLIHVGSAMAAIGARARFGSFAFATGGGTIRNQTFARFEGEGADATFGGATLLRGKEHVDHTLFADHHARGCVSREIFKAVLDDESRSVFQGRIVVRQKAQKTDARMMTQALLLSDRAEADHKPELEIFADDVQCGHGATTGALDEDLRFYLMARGIPAVEAEALLVQAFVGAAIEPIAEQAIKDALNEKVGDWLRQRGATP